MPKRLIKLPLLLAVLFVLLPTYVVKAAINIVPSSVDSSPLTTTIQSQPIITASGTLLGCSGVKAGEAPLPDKKYSSKVTWTLKHSLYNTYYLVHFKDDAKTVDTSYSGSAGGVASTFSLPTVTYFLASNEPSKTVKLKVTAYDSNSIAKSSVNCQITLINKELPQPPSTPQQNYYIIPGLQPSSSGSNEPPPVDQGESSVPDPVVPEQNSGSGSGSSSGSTPSGSGSPVSPQSSGGYPSSSSSSSTSESAPLKPGPDILTCKGSAKILYFEKDLPAYDRMGVNCVLAIPATVKAGVYSSAYDPKSADNSANLIKTVALDSQRQRGRFYLGWDGYDDYDQPVPMDKYKFVVEAELGSNYFPDISIHPFEIQNPPAIVPAPEGAASATDTPDTLRGAAAEQPAPGLLDQLGNAIFGSESATTNAAAAPAVERVASKCPTVFYPIDISGHPYESLIKKAYDECLVKGYPDGTFRIEQGLTRAEAAKIIVLASGNLAKQGCYDADCGSPFMDLDMWQGPWVRGAWDMKIVSGVAPDRFAPNREITRAEAVALAVKAFKIAPHYGCYDADCGAGLPDDPFNDITRIWQGQYLRALTDRGVLQTLTPGKFYPDRASTRGQFVELVYRVKSLK